MRRAPTLVAFCFIVAVAVGCDSTDPGTPTQYGATVAVGNGTARSYIVLDDDTPTEIGVALSETALEGLPAPVGNPQQDGYSFILPLPANNPTGYQIVELNWNAGGHPPPMVYTVPHFDFHFYTQSPAGRAAILPSDPDYGTKAANLPAAGFRPAGYAEDAAGGQTFAIPMMGVHWSDHGGPEFHGEDFTMTFIYGSWDGDFTFVEPMVTRAFLQTKPDTEAVVTVPASFDNEAYHPTRYRVKWDEGASEYRIGISGLRPH